MKERSDLRILDLIPLNYGKIRYVWRNSYLLDGSTRIESGNFRTKLAVEENISFLNFYNGVINLLVIGLAAFGAVKGIEEFLK